MLDHLIHIHQQLKQRGVAIELQTFKNLLTKPGVHRYEIPAYNESLFLTNPQELPAGTRIISDTNSFEVEYNLNVVEAMLEFSGLVALEMPTGNNDSLVIEFIQIMK